MVDLKIKVDTNGNKCLFVKHEDYRGFSIQTNGNLPYTHRNGVADYSKTCDELYAYAKLVNLKGDRGYVLRHLLDRGAK